MSILTQGLTLSCADKSTKGSIRAIYIANSDDLTSYTLGADEYASVTMVATKVFYKFEFRKDTAEFREEVTVENGVKLVTQEIEFFEPCMEQAKRDLLACLCEGCGFQVLVELACNPGAPFVVGYSEDTLKERDIEVVSISGTSGKAISDGSGYTVTLGTTATEMARTFTGVVPV